MIESIGAALLAAGLVVAGLVSGSAYGFLAIAFAGYIVMDQGWLNRE